METAHTLGETLRPLGGRQRSGRDARAGPSRLPGAARACDGDRAACCPPSPGQRTHHEKEGIL